MIGRTLAHYEVLEKIGEGGMGEVYRARDRKLGRDVALKLLPPSFARDAERVARFEREARALASLSHANIATIHGFEEVDGQSFLVMEFVEGEDLAQQLAHHRFSVSEALEIALRVSEGVEAAHERGIIHRDLKPANIKRSPDGKLKILDFGLAKVQETATSGLGAPVAESPTIPMDRTTDGVLLGTAPYMSPEQLKGEAGDLRADIWAFGCVLYELLVGRSPFRAETLAEVTARALEKEPDWQALPSSLPPSAFRLLRRCLAKDPGKRLHSAADIRIVLGEILEGVPDFESALVHPTPAGRWWRLAIYPLLLLIGAAGAVWLTPRGERAATREAAPVRLMIPVRGGNALMPIPESSSVAISPDGSEVVYVIAEMRDPTRSESQGFGDTQLVRREIDSFEVESIPGTTGAFAPSFSPDGRSIAFFSFNSGAILRIAASGGSAAVIAQVPDVDIRGIHWANDGRIYYANMNQIWAVDVAGGQPELVAEPDPQTGTKTFRFPRLLPDGRSILITVADSEILSYDDAKIAVLDLESGERQTVLDGGSDARYVPTGHLVFGRAGGIYAVPFDLEARSTRGQPALVIDGVVTSDGYGAMQMAWSETGTLVYVGGGPEQFASELMIMDRNGRLQDLEQPPRPYGQPEVSPDGTRLAFGVLGANASIWIHDLERGVSTKLISGWDNYSPIWSPDGDRVAYASNRSGRISIMVSAADGAGRPREIKSWPANFFPTSWASSGSPILTTLFSPNTGRDIAACDLEGNLDLLVATGAREFIPDFSPDGRFFSYCSDESGALEIYVQTYPITGRKWRLSEYGGDMAAWSPDGDHIYYWAEHELMRVPVQTQPDFRPGRVERVLATDSDISGFDVFPGGEKFAVLVRRPGEGGKRAMMMRAIGEGRLFPAESPDLHVVVNWFSELERLAPAN